MKNLNNELPGQIKFRNHFLNHYKNPTNLKNITAISNCYANYKILGVFYSQDIMELIYAFDDQFPLDNHNFQIQEVKKEIELVSEPVVEYEYYRPQKFNYSQARVNFKFIDFIKATNNFNLSEKKIDEKLEDIADGNLVCENNSKISSSINLIEKNTDDMISFKDGLNCETHREILENFQKHYIQIRIFEASLLPYKKIIVTAAEKCQRKVQFKSVKVDETGEFCCEIIFNKTVLLGKGSNVLQNLAQSEAIKQFHNDCVQGIDINKQVGVKPLGCPPEIEEDIEDLPYGVEIYDLPMLKNFYLRNNRLSNATGILQESFSFFKLQMTFSDLNDRVVMSINGSHLGSIDFCGNLSLTKLRLSHFVLNFLQKSKWTLMKNTMYINDFNETVSVDKGQMYEKNLVDPTKIQSNKNVGGQLMLKMGWEENSGLGKTGHGMKEPIINEMNAKRQGIGFDFGSSKDLKSFSNNVSKALRSWMNLEEDDLIFDRQFDNKERAMIHKECRKLGLISKSYNNTNGDRFLVVGYNRSPEDLFNWIQSKGGKTKLYTLMPPGSFSQANLDI